MKIEILSKYDEKKLRFEDFKRMLESLINDLLKDNEIQSHQITGRVKDRISLAKKIDKKHGKYKKILEITDIIGIRIITYLESQVDLVAEIVEKEFSIDRENSIDKRKLKADQFGYRSLHYVAELPRNRTELSEYKRFKNLKFEIQIRSILQHAWAEIEHDLGYKGITSFPDDYKRSFNRLSALLETADIEFDRLKNELLNYESSVDDLIKKAPQTVTLDQTSLTSFVKSNPILHKAKEIVKKNNSPFFVILNDYRFYLDRLTRVFNISTIKDLENSLESNETDFILFIDEYSKEFRETLVVESISLFYFLHFLASKTKDVDFVKSYINKKNFSFGIRNNPEKFIKIYNKITALNNI